MKGVSNLLLYHCVLNTEKQQTQKKRSSITHTRSEPRMVNRGHTFNKTSLWSISKWSHLIDLPRLVLVLPPTIFHYLFNNKIKNSQTEWPVFKMLRYQIADRTSVWHRNVHKHFPRSFTHIKQTTWTPNDVGWTSLLEAQSSFKFNHLTRWVQPS